jgi:hypothetical protein
MLYKAKLTTYSYSNGGFWGDEEIRNTFDAGTALIEADNKQEAENYAWDACGNELPSFDNIEITEVEKNGIILFADC